MEGVDPGSGYCARTSIYHSILTPAELPSHPTDLTTYLFASKRADAALGRTVAVVDGRTGRNLTFSQLDETVRKVAAGLWQRLGIRKSDVVAILSPNSIEFGVLFFAIASLGAITTTLNPLNTNADIKKLIRGAGAKYIFTTPELLSKAEATGLPIVLIEDEATPATKATTNLRYTDLLSTSNPAPPVTLSQSDPVAILFSSGTTGESKGVVLTHGNLIAMCAVVLSPQVDGGLNKVALHLIPMFHIFGLMVSVGNVARGVTVVILPRFDFLEMLATIQKYKVTTFPLVPPILLLMIKQEVVNKFDMTSLRNIGCGAAPLGKEQLDQCAARFPNAKLIQGYGLTESTAIGSVTPADGKEFADHFGSAGMLAPTLEAMVVDPVTNKAMPPTKQGELWLRGPTIMKEYLNNPKATAETLDKDGWMRTGDLVYFDVDGYLYIVDRLKELIKYKANQVAPAELESLLLTHPKVEDCAVIPFPDEAAGEIPMAYIVKKPGSALTAEEVMKFVAKQVASYKKIRKVAFIEAIPKSAAGKMERRKLVELSRLQAKL
jgi:acyl-CoA synthetase (AMP-forming)/AMP-acid ligase II